MREAVSAWRALRIRHSCSMPVGVPCACLRSRFASSARHPSMEVVCVKRRRSGIRCSFRSRIGGSATGVLITDNCHDIVRRWEQCAPGTRASPEQKAHGRLKHGRHRAAITGDGPRRTLVLRSFTGSYGLGRATRGTLDRTEDIWGEKIRGRALARVFWKGELAGL